MRSDILFAPDIAQVLGVSRARVWQLAKKPDFPTPLGERGGRSYWAANGIWRWCAASDRPKWAAAAPTLYRPLGSAYTPRYLEARLVDQQVVLIWLTDLGEIGLTYDFDPREPDAELIEATGCVSLVRVSDQWDFLGPEIVALDQEHPERPYHLRWAEIAPRLGGTLPWWPRPLRRIEDMLDWRPDDGQIMVPAIPEGDTEALLRVAADSHPDSPVHCTLNDLAHTMSLRETQAAEKGIERVRASDVGHLALIAARPTPVSTHSTPVSEMTARRAWLEILQRTDPLAVRCVRTVRGWNGGDDFPWSTTEQIKEPLDQAATEWRQRLEPVSLRNAPAAFEMVRRQRTSALYTDPLTGAPVGVDDRGTLTAAVPHQLPTTSPLDSVILSNEVVWVRTADGLLWMMPQHGGAGVSWGYTGTGPSTMAVTIDRLLQDITSPAVAPHEPRTTAPGLHKLTETEHQGHTVFSRAQLETARRH